MGRSKRRIETVLFEGELSNANANVNGIPEQQSDVQKKKRGKTMLKEVYELPPNRRIRVELNDWGQPVGENAKVLAFWTGIIVRANCPLNYASWHKVPSATKIHLVNLIKGITCIIYTQKKFEYPAATSVWLKKTMSKRFRDAKHELKAGNFDDSESEDVNMNNCPSDLQLDQWHYLISYWKSTQGKIVEERNKKSRLCQISSHTSGSKSFARVEHELDTKAGRKVGKIKVLEVTHKRKDGTFIDESVLTMLEKAKTAIDELPNEPSYLEELEILSGTIGTEKNGTVRGMGLGPTPTTVFKHNVYMTPARSEEYGSLQKEVVEQRDLIREQHEKMAKQDEIILQQQQKLDKQGDMLKCLDDKISLLMQHLIPNVHQ